ncbi:hypothetical protein CHS0354_013243, partial [Potamilus streckersoni]
HQLRDAIDSYFVFFDGYSCRGASDDDILAEKQLGYASVLETPNIGRDHSGIPGGSSFKYDEL